jgi:drug/metabolite transporter (DMT)-like permease
MRLSDYLRLITLAAIWGMSFLFMRVAVPIFGPGLFMFFRLTIAALFLFSISCFNNQRLYFATYWRQYLTIGFFNSALPFLLFGIGSAKLNASMLSILNSTSPVFGFIISILLGKQKVSFKAVIGMVICIFGVFILSGKQLFTKTNNISLSVFLILIAACCYGLASNYIKYSKTVHKISPFSIAHGSMWVSVILITPALFIPSFVKEEIVINFYAIIAVLGIGILSTGVAYLLYFKLIKDVGPTSALTVTFLLPIFGTLWGVVFLSESFNYHTLFGLIIILTGVGLVTNFSPKILFNLSSKDKNIPKQNSIDTF